MGGATRHMSVIVLMHVIVLAPHCELMMLSCHIPSTGLLSVEGQSWGMDPKAAEGPVRRYLPSNCVSAVTNYKLYY